MWYFGYNLAVKTILNLFDDFDFGEENSIFKQNFHKITTRKIRRYNLFEITKNTTILYEFF